MMNDFQEDMNYIMNDGFLDPIYFSGDRPVDPPESDDITDEDIDAEADRLIDEFMKVLKQADRLIDEFMKVLKPENRMLSERDIERLEDAIRPIAMNRMLSEIDIKRLEDAIKPIAMNNL